MSKKRVLLVNEAAFLNTGLGKIGRSILTGLKAAGYEVAELAGGISWEYTSDWKVYPVLPKQDNKEAIELYENYPFAKYGAVMFESVCLEFKPDIVLSINDPHSMEFITLSPFKDMYRSVLMPTIDSLPIQPKWHSSLLRADKILFYSEWAKNSKLNGETVYFPISNTFNPLDKDMMKTIYGVEDDIQLIGSIFKNQPRKQAGYLIDSFVEMLKTNKNIRLHLHTQIPPRGDEWDIIDLIEQNNLENYVYFSYVCLACDGIALSKYRGQCKFCSNCGKRSAYLMNERIKISDTILNEIINCYDLYVQYSTAEGACLPIAEALMCNVPVACPLETAMTDYKKFDCCNLTYNTFHHMTWKSRRVNILPVESAENILAFLEKIKNGEVKPTREQALEFYSEANFINRLVKVIDEVEKPKLSWDSPARKLEQKDTDIELVNIHEYMNYLDCNTEYSNTVFIKQFTDDPAKLGPPAEGMMTKDYLNQLFRYIKSFNNIEGKRCTPQNTTIE